MQSIKKEYNSFLNTEKGARAYNDFKNILYKSSDSLIETINENVIRLLVNSEEKKTIKVCDIGGGDGKRIIHILKYLNGLCDDLTFQLDLIEQSKPFCESFRQKKGEIETFCEVNIINDLFENVELQANSYDIVFLIHSIFAFEDEISINRIHSLINNTGKIIFISNACDSFLAKLKKYLDKDYKDERFEIDKLESILRVNNIGFEKHFFDTKFQIPACDTEKKTDKILNWLSLGRYNSDFSTDEQIEAKKYLLSLKEKEEGENLHFTEKEILLIIPPLKIKLCLF